MHGHSLSGTVIVIWKGSQVDKKVWPDNGPDPVFCRFVLPCQIFLPPIKTVGSTILQRKMLPVKLFIHLLMSTPTTTLNLPLQ